MSQPSLRGKPSPAGGVTYTVTTFVVKDRDGRQVGVAAIAPDARYASVLWAGRGRIDRAFVSPKQWRDIEQALSGSMPAPGPLPTDHPVAALLMGDSTSSVAQLHQMPVEAERPEQTAEALDRHLRLVSSPTADALTSE